jgi:hypothetical protein
MTAARLPTAIGQALRRGMVIPAHPLALTRRRRLDERRQRALTRYYLDAGAGGLAIGVHTTQFAIRKRGIDLFEPVLALGAESIAEWEIRAGRRVVRIAGVIGATRQALREAALARDHGYDLALVSLAGLGDWTDRQLVAHVRAIGETIPVMGFYLQTAVGGRPLGYDFWRRLVELPALAAIKVAPFDRYRTLDVVRAVLSAGREREVALYTGNDDAIVLDLATPFAVPDARGRPRRLRMAGGLLGHWAFWTRTAVRHLTRCRAAARRGATSGSLLTLGAEITDANGAVFDAAHGFRGCIPGIHEVLRHQGLLAGRWCLDPGEELSPGQAAEIARVHRAYPHLADDDFVRERLAGWLR